MASALGLVLCSYSNAAVLIDREPERLSCSRSEIAYAAYGHTPIFEPDVDLPASFTGDGHF